MTEYKCGDCFHAELCEKSEIIVGFSRDNPAYCGMFLNCADVAPVRHGRWELYGNDDDLAASFFCSLCGWNMDEDKYLDRWSHLNYCPNCGAKMDKEASE